MVGWARRIWLVAVVSAPAWAIACNGGGDQPPGAAIEAGAVDAGVPVDPGIPINCQMSNVATDGPLVQTIVMPPATGQPMGGTIAGGLYQATVSRFYPEGDCSYSDEDSAETYVVTTVSDTTGAVEAAGRSASGEQSHAWFVYSTSGTTLTLWQACQPTMTSGTVSYTATPTQIRLYETKKLDSGETCGTHLTVLTKP